MVRKRGAWSRGLCRHVAEVGWKEGCRSGAGRPSCATRWAQRSLKGPHGGDAGGSERRLSALPPKEGERAAGPGAGTSRSWKRGKRFSPEPLDGAQGASLQALPPRPSDSESAICKPLSCGHLLQRPPKVTHPPGTERPYQEKSAACTRAHTHTETQTDRHRQTDRQTHTYTPVPAHTHTAVPTLPMVTTGLWSASGCGSSSTERGPRPGMSSPQRQLTSLAAPGVPAPAPCFPGLHAGHEQQMVSLGDPQRPCGLTGGACLGSQRRGDPAGDREAG